MKECKIGLEAEAFLLKNGKPTIIPSPLPKDDIPLLVEIRGEPHTTTQEVVGSFFSELVRVSEIIKKENLGKLRFLPSITVPIELYRKALEVSSNKKSAQYAGLHNVHDIDMSTFFDSVMKSDKIVGQKMSCGLHVHFSNSIKFLPAYSYREVTVHLIEGIQLYKKSEIPPDYITFSTLTIPDMISITHDMDVLFDKFKPKELSKYRQPGFFKIKPHGMEYRSLPATNKTININALTEIVNTAFKAVATLTNEKEFFKDE